MGKRDRKRKRGGIESRKEKMEKGKGGKKGKRENGKELMRNWYDW